MFRKTFWTEIVPELCACSPLQFNYMHECFERIFCELKWRKEVLITFISVSFFTFFVICY